jgi:hypothetical protein
MGNRKREVFIEIPKGKRKKHLIEIWYEEIAPGVWQKIPGSEKDLGLAKDEDDKDNKTKK